MNYRLLLLSSISKPNVDRMELSFYWHAIVTFASKPSFDLSMCEVSNFLLKIVWQCFLFTNQTIVLFALLPNLCQSSTSLLVIEIFIAPKPSMIFSSKLSSGICEWMPWISVLFLYVYCSRLLRKISTSVSFFFQQFHFFSQLSIIFFLKHQW